MIYSSSGIRRQQGASLIMFLLMIPILLGFMILSVEGGRYLRTKSAVADATEVAALAISARASQSEETNEKLAEKYIQALLPDGRDISVSVTRKECSEIDDCEPNWGEQSAFIQFDMTTNATFDSWFPKSEDNSLAFDKEVTIGNSAAVRKFQGEGALDVIFAADFSGGMRCRLGQTEGCPGIGDEVAPDSKVELLKGVLLDVAETIEKISLSTGQENTMAFVPFSSHSNEDYRHHSGEVCGVHQSVSPTGDPKQDSGLYANPQDTFDNMFITKECDGGRNNTPPFFTIEQFDTSEELNEIFHNFRADGSTSIFSGIIRAGKIALQRENQRRLIIVMTDGIDNGPNNDSMNMIDYKINFEEHHSELNKLGYCQAIRQEINNQPSSDPNKSIMSRIVAIGFDYDVSENKNLQACIGDESEIYSAENFEEVYNIIIGLLAEEVGHLHRS